MKAANAFNSLNHVVMSLRTCELWPKCIIEVSDCEIFKHHDT